VGVFSKVASFKGSTQKQFPISIYLFSLEAFKFIKNNRNRMRGVRTRKQRGRGLLFSNGGGCSSCSSEFLGGSKQKQRNQKKQQTRKKQEKQENQENQEKQGGDCGCGARMSQPTQWKDLTGGSKPTTRNQYSLAKQKRGESIGFTMRSSLKAKGLIPRSNGTYKVSPKYRS